MYIPSLLLPRCLQTSVFIKLIPWGFGPPKWGEFELWICVWACLSLHLLRNPCSLLHQEDRFPCSPLGMRCGNEWTGLTSGSLCTWGGCFCRGLSFMKKGSPIRFSMLGRSWTLASVLSQEIIKTEAQLCELGRCLQDKNSFIMPLTSLSFCFLIGFWSSYSFTILSALQCF